MQAPEHISYFPAHHANGSFTASNTPCLKNSHNTAPNFVTPQPNNTLPLPGAAEHNLPLADNTIASLTSFNHRKQFGRDGLGRKVTSLYQMTSIIENYAYF